MGGKRCKEEGVGSRRWKEEGGERSEVMGIVDGLLIEDYTVCLQNF